MREFIRNLSIKNKIITIILIMVILANLSGFTLYFFVYKQSAEKELVSQMHTIAKLESEYLIRAIEFDFEDEAKDIISKLKSIPIIKNAYVLTDKDNLYVSIDSTNFYMIDIDHKIPYYEFTKQMLYINYPINYKMDYLGSLNILVSTDKFRSDLFAMIKIALLIISLTILISLLIAYKFQKWISNPILSLGETAKNITENLDYSIRISTYAKDEIGDLYSSFNEMIRQIHQKEKERDQAVQEQIEHQEKFKKLFELTEDAIIISKISENKASIIIDANPATTIQTGYTRQELIGMNISNLLIVDDKDIKRYSNIKKKLLNGSNISISEKKRRKDGGEYWVDVSLTTFNVNNEKLVVSVNRDITDKIKMQEHLNQAQKMESIGTLAGGIAHDFNNILTAINGYAELGQLTTDKSDSNWEILENISESGEKARKLVGQLLGFSRKQIIQPKVLNLNTIINEMDTMLQRMISEDIKITKKLDENLPYIKADPSQLEQIFINLVVNARDAINEKTDIASNKLINIITEYKELDADFCKNRPEFVPGKYIVISVTDNGIGIEKEKLDKIFDPFYTTKEQGKGTGLGLSTIFGIVKQNNGDVQVYSEYGIGTTFKIYWPVKNVISEIENEEMKDTEIYIGDETILIVEDEEVVLNVATIVLSKFGYSYYTASNGIEALKIMEEKSDEIDLVITDLIMPEMNGKELVKHLKQFYPHVKVIFVSGYTDEILKQEEIVDESVNFLSKPYSVSAFSKIIRNVLDGKI